MGAQAQARRRGADVAALRARLPMVEGQAGLRYLEARAMRLDILVMRICFTVDDDVDKGPDVGNPRRIFPVAESGWLSPTGAVVGHAPHLTCL